MSTAKDFTDDQKTDLLRKIQSDLPPAWVVQFSKKHVNRVFFFNTKDGTRTWEHPGLVPGSSSRSKPSDRKRKSDGAKTGKLAQNANAKSDSTDKIITPNKDTAISSLKLKKEISPQTCSSITKASVSAIHYDAPTKKKRKRKKKSSKKAGEIAIPTVPDSQVNRDCKTPIKSAETVSNPVRFAKNVNSVAAERETLPKEDSPPADEDVEMTELDVTPPKKQHLVQQESVASRTVTTNIFPESYYCVIDTNVLLRRHSLDFIEMVVEQKRNDKILTKNLTFIIPWVVLQELDHLKKGKASARSAISFLNTQFQASHSIIRGQSIFEAATVIDGFTSENNDDRILQCCFFMQQLADGNIPILITQDKNLVNKSLVNGIKCFEDVADIQKLIGEITSKAIFSPSKVGLLPTPNLNLNESAVSSPGSKRKGKQSRPSDSAKEIFVMANELILPTLRFILEKEMKDAFGELWLDIVLRKPPWSLKDVLMCIRKHWLAVFKVLGVDHIVQDQTSYLQTMESNRDSADIEFVKKWVSASINLIAGISQKGNYLEPVKSNLMKLQKLHKILADSTLPQEAAAALITTKISNAREETSQNSTQDDNTIEMTEETNSMNLWTALDKIWTSIISHCGMILQSLSFVPSRISSSPEICQALSANYDKIPPKPIAKQALPFVKDLVESLQSSLAKFISISTPNDDFGAVFMDLLQTLWTTIQAFSVDCDMRSLINSHQEICLSILSSEEMIQRLKVGLDQLEVVKELLGECLQGTTAG